MKISIITVCKDPGESLKKTVESVLSQTYQNIEYIVIDGASTDGTREYLEEIAGLISKGERFFAPTRCFNFISEPDSGIYNAMNKGISLATGDVLYFLNAGDALYERDTIEFFVQKFFDHPSVDMVYGNVILEYNSNCLVEKKFDRVGRYFFYHDTINHQSVFFRNRIFKKLGLFNEEFKICSDYEKIMQVVSAGFDHKYFDKKVCVYKMDGLSSKAENFHIYQNERKSIKKIYFSFKEENLFSSWLYRKVRILLRRLGFKIYG